MRLDRTVEGALQTKSQEVGTNEKKN